MCDPVSALAAASGLMVANQYQQGEDAKKAQAAATAQATANAKTAADQADQANNRANGKQPDVAGITSATAQAAKGGISSTMLTGPQGIDPSKLLLGKTTLLGG